MGKLLFPESSFFLIPNLVMRFAPRPLLCAALAALPLLAASCTEKPKATDPEKTAVVVPASTMATSDSTAMPADSVKKK